MIVLNNVRYILIYEQKEVYLKAQAVETQDHGFQSQRQTNREQFLDKCLD